MIYSVEDHCKFCVHYTQERSCKAFPQQIPDDLWQGENLHDVSYLGDNGYRYEPVEIDTIRDFD